MFLPSTLYSYVGGVKHSNHASARQPSTTYQDCDKKIEVVEQMRQVSAKMPIPHHLLTEILLTIRTLKANYL